MAIIVLPRSAIKELNKKYVKIEIPDDQLQQISYADLDSVKKTWGMLKDKKEQLLRYLNESRDEWQ